MVCRAAQLSYNRRRKTTENHAARKTARPMPSALDPVSWWTDLKLGLSVLTRLPVRAPIGADGEAGDRSLGQAGRVMPLVGVVVELLETASYSVSGGTPALTPIVNASDRMTPTLSPTRLLTILQTAPEPRSPQYITLSPIRSKTALYFSYVDSSPPTITHKVPFSAPPVPPLTGASSTFTPLDSAASDIRWTVSGSVVLRSKKAVPRDAPLRMPPSPVATSSTS